MRSPLWLLPCALVACSTEPAPPDPAKELAKLEEVERRLQQLEKDWEKSQDQIRNSTHAEPAPQLGKMAVDVLEEAPPDTERTMSVEVTSTGYRVDGEELDDEAIAKRLEAWVTQHGDASLLVRADEGVDHSKVVALLDMAKERGVRRLAIATKSDDAEG
jgi:hypothetical protein